MNAKDATDRNWTSIYIHKIVKEDLLKTGHGGQSANDLIQGLVKMYNRAKNKGLLKELMDGESTG